MENVEELKRQIEELKRQGEELESYLGIYRMVCGFMAEIYRT